MFSQLSCNKRPSSGFPNSAATFVSSRPGRAFAHHFAASPWYTALESANDAPPSVVVSEGEGAGRAAASTCTAAWVMSAAKGAEEGGGGAGAVGASRGGADLGVGFA